MSELIRLYQKSETMKKYLKAKKVMEQSADVNLLINDFSIKKEQFEKVVPYQKYAPEFREKQRAVRLAKRQLDLHEKVADFRCMETQLQDLLDKISQQLAETVSLTIKIDAGNPFLNKRGVVDVEVTVMNDEKNEFQLTKRRGLIVWVYSLKQLKNLKKFGLLHYVSRKMKYVVLYLNEDTFEQTAERINKLHFVRKVERSYRPDVEMNFADKIGTKQPVKEEGFEIEEINTKIRLADHVF